MSASALSRGGAAVVQTLAALPWSLRQTVDIQPGEDVLKYIQDCFDNDNGLPINILDEDEMILGSPALLIEEQQAPRDMSSVSQTPQSSFPWNTAGSESEDEFVIAESFGIPAASWFLEPKVNRVPRERRLTSPLLEIDKATKQWSIGNEPCGRQSPAVEQDGSLSKQPQSIVRTAQRSSTSKQKKSPRNASLKKQAESKRKNIRGPVRDPGRKHKVLVSEKSVENESKELCSKWPGAPLGDRLTVSGKRIAHFDKMIEVTPENGCGGALPQEGSCEEEKIFSSTEQQNSRIPSMCGPVYSQNDKASFEYEMMIRNNIEDSFSKSPIALEEDSSLLASDSLKDKEAYLRRSKRVRLKPLEYWRGERVKYERRPSGLVVSGIISPVLKEPHKLKRTEEPMKKDLGKELGYALKDVSQPVRVFDAASEQMVLEKCVSSGHSHMLFFNNEALSVYKYFSTPLFSTGKVILKPFKEKGYQYSLTDTLVFHIVKGRVLFTLCDNCYSLCTGDYFYVPAGNAYNVQNTLNEECIVSFTQIKGNRSKGE